MGLRQISQEEYTKRQQEIVDTANNLVTVARDQLSFIRSVQDPALRKKLVSNEKAVYAVIKQLYTLTLRNSRVCVKKDASPNMKSGFAKQKPISQAMSDFAKACNETTGEEWDVGALKSRNEVTRLICNYIKNNKLNSPEDKRRILPDAYLSALISSSERTPTLGERRVCERVDESAHPRSPNVAYAEGGRVHTPEGRMCALTTGGGVRDNVTYNYIQSVLGNVCFEKS
jgi:hypothetical protein